MLAHRGVRLHLGALLALALISLIAFAVFPLRHYRVRADGVSTAFQSRQSGTEALLAQAGVRLLAGDRVRSETAPDGSSLVAIDRALPVILEVDGQRLGWRSHAQTVEGVMAEAGLRLGPYDTVTLNGIPVDRRDRIDAPRGLALARALSVRLPAAAMAPDARTDTTLVVRRAVPFTVRDGDSVRGLSSGEPTVGLALRQRGVLVGPGDLVQPGLSEPLVAGQDVIIERARAVTISVGDSDVQLYTRATTVEEVLRDAGLTLAENQRVYPPLEAALEGGEQIRIVSVSSGTYIESETVPHTTVYRLDPSLAEGETRRVPGSDGVLYRERVIHYEDGRETSRELVNEWYEPEPVNTVVYFGEAPAEDGSLVIASAPESMNVVRTMRVYATWYTPASSGIPSSDPSYGLTATGVPVAHGIVAVDPSVIPLGTRMYIPGYGYAVAADTGGAVVGDIIDLAFPDGVEPNWTPGWIEIYILGP